MPVTRTPGKTPDCKNELISRRSILKGIGLAPFALRAAPFFGSPLLFDAPDRPTPDNGNLKFADVRLSPHYPQKTSLADVLRLVAPGSDNYPTEKYASDIESLLKTWGLSLKVSVRDHAALARVLAPSITASSLIPVNEIPLRAGDGVIAVKRQFPGAVASGHEKFLNEIHAWLEDLAQVETAEFEIYGIQQVDSSPLTIRADTRYDIVARRAGVEREERVGSWRIEWSYNPFDGWKAQRWEASEEILAVAREPVFIDVTSQALGQVVSYNDQLLHGADYWRTVLDGACGIDIYNNTGVSAGDFDNDGFDDLYICQPAGLPNRLYRNRGDGTFEDVTEKAGVSVLDNTACALFADFENRGLQDLLVVCDTGPLLFANQGNGTFTLRQNAFKFARPPQGSFTHAAVADYDHDGRLDIYFCTYMYYLGLDQYHYPVPYYDARNGPPNCLFHNEGNGLFVETTKSAGLDVENNRYSFACAWGDSNSNGLPDLFVANDFGTSQLYRNNGDGTFKFVSKEAHVEDVGAGMGCSWADYDNDGHQDVYVPSMWEAAGQRVSEQKQFHSEAPDSIRLLYQRHAKGNALYRNQGNGEFQNAGHQAGVEMGRWSWSADFWDFDHDGYSDLYVANGYISGPNRNDVTSFFWRQVVAKSPDDARSSEAYQRGWNAINELIRSDSTWHGFARNVMFANNRNGTFSEISGPAGLDFIDDSRSFTLADIDHDGRLEVVLKNRNSPQVRILRNAMREIGHSISFWLKGTKSNRDAIGVAVTVEAGSLRQTKYLQAGSGFLSQHSKELFFGLGKMEVGIRATVHWPSGLVQQFENIPVNHRIGIEEGRISFRAEPFTAPPISYRQPGPSPKLEQLPTDIETWLIESLRAPQFSLPDLTGAVHDLQQLQGSFVLLNFWTTASPLSLDQLRLLNRHGAALAADRLKLLAVNVDDPENLAKAHLLTAQERFDFAVVFATPEVAGIYNIFYRYLFDRHRNLPIPASFLLDKDGRIIKVYQGAIDPQHLLNDARSAPTTAAERVSKAIPFSGKLYQNAFQRNDFTYGVALFQHGYLDQAEASFKQVVELKPDNAEGYYNLGTLSLRRNNLEQARAYLEKTLKLRPDYPEAWNNLGMIAAQEGMPHEAIRNFQQALTLRPDYVIALLNLGNLFRRQGNFERSEQYLNSALQLEPDNPEINYSYGMLCAQQNQTEDAERYLQKAIALRPDYPEALNNLGVLFVHVQNLAKAEEEFKTCIRLVPNFDQSYLNLASLYAMQNEIAKAKDVLHQLLRIDPANSAAGSALELLK